MISRLIKEDKDYLAFYKPSGLPTVPLKGKSGLITLLGEVSSLYPEVLEVTGANPWEGSALHRLDTPTSGIVIFARSQESYDYLQQVQRADSFIKYYRVLTSDIAEKMEGFPIYPYKDPASADVCISSGFRTYGRKGASVRPVTDNPRYQSGRVYETEVHKESDGSYICVLRRGFRHQIRCHMAWSGHPIAGDVQYGAAASASFGLEAVSVSFPERSGRTVFYGEALE